MTEVRHLHKDYHEAFCGLDASFIPMTWDEAEFNCDACRKGKAEHDRQAAAEKLEMDQHYENTKAGHEAHVWLMNDQQEQPSGKPGKRSSAKADEKRKADRHRHTQALEAGKQASQWLVDRHQRLLETPPPPPKTFDEARANKALRSHKRLAAKAR